MFPSLLKFAVRLGRAPVPCALRFVGGAPTFALALALLPTIPRFKASVALLLDACLALMTFKLAFRWAVSASFLIRCAVVAFAFAALSALDLLTFIDSLRFLSCFFLAAFTFDDSTQPSSPTTSPQESTPSVARSRTPTLWNTVYFFIHVGKLPISYTTQAFSFSSNLHMFSPSTRLGALKILRPRFIGVLSAIFFIISRDKSSHAPISPREDWLPSTLVMKYRKCATRSPMAICVRPFVLVIVFLIELLYAFTFL